ncbi:phage tail protein I [Bosea sp. (in: a-proteobacteria)]|uniref:phage tail protein I n=1 Tax=Bosea sp. (in: a-proteobacteria) TaxID=1871050 RepID=UPI003566A67F
MTERFDSRLIPPSIHDARSRAFGEVLRRALAEPDFRKLLMERIDDVDAALLPFLVREFGLQHFVEPGMTEAVIRRLLKGSFRLHAEMGYIHGVRTGLDMLGIGVTSWAQWFQQEPQGAPGTHIVTVSVDDEVFIDEGRAITSRLQRAIGRMVRRMRRFSQFIAIRFTAASEAPVHVGMAVITRLRISPSIEPITTLMARPPLFIGAVVASRIRISPRLP